MLTQIHWDEEISPGGELQLTKKVRHTTKLINILTDEDTAGCFQVLKLDVGMYTYLDDEPIPLKLMANLVAKAYGLGPAFGNESITFMLQNTSNKSKTFAALLVLEYEISVEYGPRRGAL